MVKKNLEKQWQCFHMHIQDVSEDCVKPCLYLDVVLYRMDAASATVCSYMFENTVWISLNLKCFLRKTLLVCCSCSTYMMLL